MEDIKGHWALQWENVPTQGQFKKNTVQWEEGPPFDAISRVI